MNSLSQPTKVFTPWRTQILRAACYLLFAFGILALGYAGIVFADSHIYQAVEIQKLERVSPPSVPHILAEGDMLGELQVPRLGLTVIVVQGDSSVQPAAGRRSPFQLPSAGPMGKCCFSWSPRHLLPSAPRYSRGRLNQIQEPGTKS